VNGSELYRIRKFLNLTPDAFAMQLGYRGNSRNNSTLITKYEKGLKQIPLTVASLAWLLEQWVILNDAIGYGDALPTWPEWPGYEKELEPLKPDDDPAGGPPADTESDVS
jgi:transcriptional regulator with XRE-family HTH domain